MTTATMTSPLDYDNDSSIDDGNDDDDRRRRWRRLCKMKHTLQCMTMTVHSNQTNNPMEMTHRTTIITNKADDDSGDDEDDDDSTQTITMTTTTASA